MSKKILLLAFFSMLTCLSLFGQQYDARGYWRMEHDTAYARINGLQMSGRQISPADQAFVDDYKARLAAYFEKMTDAEKAKYFSNRASWNETPSRVSINEEDQVYSGERSTFTKYVISSGIWGFFYGSAADYVVGVEGPGAAGFPLVAGGLSAIIPVLSSKDKRVTTNSLNLSLQGRGVGAFQGAMLGFLFVGDNGTDGTDKLIVGLSVASSITLGRIGYNLGRTKDWSQGRVALYGHYAWLVPLESMAVLSAMKVDNSRVLALGSLAGCAGGYLIANRIANRHDYTRGDIISMQTLTLMNAGLGASIYFDIQDKGAAAILVPAAGALAGTLLGQEWMRNAHLTNQQGRNIALSTTAGVVVGFGVDILASIDETPFVYIIPYLTGMLAYTLTAENYRVKNIGKPLASYSKHNFQFSFTPQNILINNKFISSGHYTPYSRQQLLPAFSAVIRF